MLTMLKSTKMTVSAVLIQTTMLSITTKTEQSRKSSHLMSYSLVTSTMKHVTFVILTYPLLMKY